MESHETETHQSWIKRRLIQIDRELPRNKAGDPVVGKLQYLKESQIRELIKNGTLVVMSRALLRRIIEELR